MVHAIRTYIQIGCQAVMKDKLAGIHGVDDVAAAIAKQRVHGLDLLWIWE